jgi:hypothetical protein
VSPHIAESCPYGQPFVVEAAAHITQDDKVIQNIQEVGLAISDIKHPGPLGERHCTNG